MQGGMVVRVVCFEDTSIYLQTFRGWTSTIEMGDVHDELQKISKCKR